MKDSICKQTNAITTLPALPHTSGIAEAVSYLGSEPVHHLLKAVTGEMAPPATKFLLCDGSGSGCLSMRPYTGLAPLKMFTKDRCAGHSGLLKVLFAADSTSHAAESIQAMTSALDLQSEAKQVQMSSKAGKSSNVFSASACLNS